MACKWCHEGNPVNRKDGFCSDMCQIYHLQAENKRLKADLASVNEVLFKNTNAYQRLQADIDKKNKALTYAVRFLDPADCDREYVEQALKGGA